MHTPPRKNPLWLSWARKLHAIKTEGGVGCSCRTTIRPHETALLIERIEKSYGVELPPSYRDFLLRYDGWPQVFRGASLLSCEQLLDPSWLYLAESAVRKAHTPVPGFPSSDWRNEDLMPIGLDATADIVFVLDPSSKRPDGEMEAVVWISELGIRVACFADLLEVLCDLSEVRDTWKAEATVAAA